MNIQINEFVLFDKNFNRSYRESLIVFDRAKEAIVHKLNTYEFFL